MSIAREDTENPLQPAAQIAQAAFLQRVLPGFNLLLSPEAQPRMILSALSTITDVKVRNYGRHLFASASHESPDGQGCITVPPHLREYAGLSKDFASIGNVVLPKRYDECGSDLAFSGVLQQNAAKS